MGFIRWYRLFYRWFFIPVVDTPFTICRWFFIPVAYPPFTFCPTWKKKEEEKEGEGAMKLLETDVKEKKSMN
jgi:hypothetical protein